MNKDELSKIYDDFVEIGKTTEPWAIGTTTQDRWMLYAGIIITAQASKEPILEIGTGFGGSALTMAKAALKNVGESDKVLCVDLWEQYTDEDGTVKNPDITQFMSNAKSIGLSHMVIPIRADSRVFSKYWSKPIRLLFVDGCHSQEIVYHDVIEYGKFVQVKGIIFCHDYSFYQVTKLGVDRAFKDFDITNLPYRNTRTKYLDVFDNLACITFNDETRKLVNEAHAFFREVNH